MMVDTSKLARPTNRKGAPPEPAETGATLKTPPTGQKVPLQLKISPELRREFRAHAAERDLELSELFTLAWAFYKEHHG
jgi:hypothetical protein